MRGDACGGHGKDEDGKYIRDDNCDWCQRWDWVIWNNDQQNAVAHALCRTTRCFHIDKEVDDSWYDLTKGEWRSAGVLIEYLLAEGLAISSAPGPCSLCKQLPHERIHMNILEAGGVKHNPDQHPYLGGANG
jgi:hypothetical protein